MSVWAVYVRLHGSCAFFCTARPGQGFDWQGQNAKEKPNTASTGTFGQRYLLSVVATRLLVPEGQEPCPTNQMRPCRQNQALEEKKWEGRRENIREKNYKSHQRLGSASGGQRCSFLEWSGNMVWCGHCCAWFQGGRAQSDVAACGPATCSCIGPGDDRPDLLSKVQVLDGFEIHGYDWLRVREGKPWAHIRSEDFLSRQISYSCCSRSCSFKQTTNSQILRRPQRLLTTTWFSLIRCVVRYVTATKGECPDEAFSPGKQPMVHFAVAESTFPLLILGVDQSNS